jgi:hypothetical protein
MKRRAHFFQAFQVGAAFFALAIVAWGIARAADYEVGPGKPFRAIGQVPWGSLGPGDHVKINWRPEPYREKWVICGRGTERAPITVSGVPGPNGELPVIDGENAVTAKQPAYWGEARSVIKIGGSEETKKIPPAWILLENLEVRNARPPFGSLGVKGITRYVPHAAGVWIESGEHITVRGCAIHDCANGLFSSNQSREVLVERCRIEGNGMEKSIFQHNIYTESNGITFQYNRLGPLRPGCLGNNLKDRSAGLVVRGNWIEGGNRELDLVDADDNPAIRSNPAYYKTFVYGNLILEPPGDPGNQIVHYGGDMGKPAAYREGTLYFYHNTVVSRRADKTVLFRLMTQNERVDCRHNILRVTAPGRTLAMLDSVGQLHLANNWISPGWVPASGKSAGKITGGGCAPGAAPGFVNEAGNDFHLTGRSPCRGAGGALHPDALPAYRVLNEYVLHQSARARRDAASSAPDLGAFGFDDGR